MKKLSTLCLFASIAVSPNLWADPLPGHTSLTSLPKDATLVVKKDITLEKTRTGDEFILIHRVSRNSRFDLNRSMWVRCKNKRTFAAQPGDPVKLKINSVYVDDDPLQIYDSSGNKLYKLHEMNLYFTTDQPGLDTGCRVMINTADLPSPRTVSDAMAYLSEYFDFINDVDPYAGMEKSIVIDLLMAKITNSLKAEDHLSALQAFAKLERMGENLPESYYYYYAETLLKSGNKEKARTYATLYLNKYGKKGKYYSQAVDIMSRV